MSALRAKSPAGTQPASGLNPAADRLRPSATLAINEHCARLVEQGREVVRLGFGQSPFPVPQPVVEELRRHAHEKVYLPVQGLSALREAVSDYYRRTEGLVCDPGQIIVGPGSKELMFILQLTLEAEVLIPSPSWVSYAPQAGLFNRPVQWLSTSIATGLKIAPEQIGEACRRNPGQLRLLILNSPGNPTGATYTSQELEAIAAAARENRVLILADEIYSGLHFKGGHISIARFYPEGTIVSNGLSKWCGAGGWRLGTFVMPTELNWLTNAMLAVASETFTSVAAPIQYAAIKAFSDDPEIEAYLAGCRQILHGVASAVAQRLRSAGTRLCKAEGGFYMFPDFSTTARAKTVVEHDWTAESFCARALEETGVAILPGSDFGYPGSRLASRMAFVDFDGTAALCALTGTTPDDAFLDRYCQPTLKGVELLSEWLSAN